MIWLTEEVAVLLCANGKLATDSIFYLEYGRIKRVNCEGAH